MAEWLTPVDDFLYATGRIGVEQVAVRRMSIAVRAEPGRGGRQRASLGSTAGRQ